MTTISVQITGNEEYGRWIKALVCGDPGSGKTLISSTFPNPIYASAEGGLMSIARRKIPFVKIDASEKLLALKNALDQEPEVRAKLLGLDQRGMTRVDTVVIDTIDEVARLLIKERQEANKKDTLAIQDWGWLGDQMRGIIRAFRNLDMHVVFTCHLKQSEDSETGRLFFKPAIQGAVGDEISGYVDLALLLKAHQVAKVVDGETKRITIRTLRTAPDPAFPWIKDRSGQLPAELEVNFDDDFERINTLIFGGMVEIESTLVEFAAQPDPPASLEIPAVPAEDEAGSAEDDKNSSNQSGGSLSDEGPTGNGQPSEAELEPEEQASESETSVPVEPPPGVDPVTGEITTTVEAVRAMSTQEKMKISSPYPCEDCGSAFDNEDQRDLAVIKTRKVLCTPCYKSAVKK